MKKDLICRNTIYNLQELINHLNAAEKFYKEVLELNFTELSKMIELLYDDKGKILNQLEHEVVRLHHYYKGVFWQSSVLPNLSLKNSTLYYRFNNNLNSLLNKCYQIEYNLIWEFKETMNSEILGEVLPVLAKQFVILTKSSGILAEFIDVHRDSYFKTEFNINELNTNFVG